MNREILKEMLSTNCWKKFGLQNFLVPGLCSTLLTEPRHELTITMMIVPPSRGDVLPFDGLAPHDHSYDLSIYVANGTLIDNRYLDVTHNLTYAMFCDSSPKEYKETVKAGTPYFEYQYFAKRLLGFEQVARLGGPKTMTYFPGAVYGMTRDQIHSIVVPEQPVPTIWVREEKFRYPKPTRLFSKKEITNEDIADTSVSISSDEIEPFLTQAGLL